MEQKMRSSYIYKIVAILVALALAGALLFACGEKKDEPVPEPEKEKIEFTANSPIGIAESYIGKEVKGLIEEVGTLKEDPIIEPSNDGGGYQGIYEFDGFTVHTYAKSEDAEAIVTEVIPDESSEVYKKSIKTSGDSDVK